MSLPQASATLAADSASPQGIIQYRRVGRRHVADDIAGHDFKMQVAMAPARINRMRGIVIIDPVVHDCLRSGYKTGSGRGTGMLVMR